MDKLTTDTDSGAGNAPGTPPGLVLAPDSTQEPITTPARPGGAGALPGGRTSAPASAASPAKRKPGRPRGTPKSGGRKKGTPNRSTVQTRDRIQELADPIAFLADVMGGKRMTAAGELGDKKRTWAYPTLAQRVQASETLLRKLLPDLKATELTGKDGAPLIEPTRRAELLGTMEAARLILATLREGVEAETEFNELDAPTIDAEPVLISSPEEAETPPLVPCTQRGEIPLCGVQSGSDAKRT